jgi:hypothetical protein
MSSSHPRAAALAIALWSALAPAGAETPPGLFGEYHAAARRVCAPGGGGHRSVCSRSIDVMRIERVGYEGDRDVKVRAEFTLPDGQYCQLEGRGAWNANARTLLVTDALNGCQFSFSPHGRELRGWVTAPQQCNSPCAGREWLTGVVFRKK